MTPGDHRPSTIAEAFAVEVPRLQNLPVEEFDPALVVRARVDLRARDLGSPVLLLGAGPLRRAAGDRTTQRHHGGGSRRTKLVAAHERAAGRHVEVLALDHYLEVLAAKPGLCRATALAQAKSSGAFTSAHQRFWDAARRLRGDAAGTRALIEVLLAHRSLPTAAAPGGDEHRGQPAGCAIRKW